MNCEQIDSILDRHATNALSAAERVNVDTHLASCPRCADAWHAHGTLAAEVIVPARDGLLAETLRRVVAPAGVATAQGARPLRAGTPYAALVPYGVAAALAVVAIAVLVAFGGLGVEDGARRPVAGPPAAEGEDPAESAGDNAAEAVAPAAEAAESRVELATEEPSEPPASVRTANPPANAPAAAPARYVEGTHYERFAVAQPTSVDANRIEVTFAFMYGCRGCYVFEPRFERWQASAAEDVEVVHLPAVFNDLARLHARAFYTAQALGLLDRTHPAFFAEIHERGNPLASRAALTEFFARFGVDAASFDETFDSFAVAARLSRAEQLGRAYRLGQTPTVVVNGRYWTVPRMAGSYEATFEVVEDLVEAERREACPAAPPC